MIPILIVSDAPTTGSGLGRITADVARIATISLSDVFRVATLGYGGIASCDLPWHHYSAENMDGWIIHTLPEIWKDWARNETGVVMFISDPGRLGWFSRPEMVGLAAKYPDLSKFLLKPPFQKWIYAPVDASGPNHRLSFPLAQSLRGFDRILAYGKFGEDVIRRSIGEQDSEKRRLTSLPHGINVDTFYPRNRQSSRAFFLTITGACTMRGEKELIREDETLIGIVATNQSRKDFGLALETVSILSRQRKVRLWIHTDEIERVGCWSIPALLIDFGILDRTLISVGRLPDDDLAKAYSACDITLAPGAEGFGYPIAESLACGTPVVTGDYAGGAELAPLNTVTPVAFRYESTWACERPVYKAQDWVDKITKVLEYTTTYNFSLDPRYDWRNNIVSWEKWFREAARKE